MISFLKLVRCKNLLMILLTLILTKHVLIHSFTTTSYSSNFQFIILALSILCITAGGYIINDILDIEADKINKPTTVFIGNTISVKNAWFAYWITAAIGLLLGIYVSIQSDNNTYSFIFIFTSIGLYIYSKKLKRLPLIGNIMVALLVSLSIFIIILFEDSVEKNNSFIAVLSYSIFSFITTLTREIIKDIEDIKGDYALKMRTLPIVIGIYRTNRITVVITGILFAFLIFVAKVELTKYPYLLIYVILCIILPLAGFLYKLWNAKNTKHYQQLSTLLKLIMLFGILSMLIFKFN
jgi:4-hydroxybenzoate polyprenyltransferase